MSTDTSIEHDLHYQLGRLRVLSQTVIALADGADELPADVLREVLREQAALLREMPVVAPDDAESRAWVRRAAAMHRDRAAVYRDRRAQARSQVRQRQIMQSAGLTQRADGSWSW